MTYPCVTKKWEDYLNVIELEDKMIECDAIDQLPFYNNRFDCYAGDVLYRINIYAAVVNSVKFLYHGKCIDLSVFSTGPNECFAETFPKGFPLIYLFGMCCNGPRIQLEIDGESICNKTEFVLENICNKIIEIILLEI